jgi:hypothetical protein
VNDDLDRWIHLEGPPPDEIRELLDAAIEDPDLTPEREARMDRRLFAAIAEDRRRWAQRRALRRALGGGLAAACVVGALVLAFRLGAPHRPAILAHRGLPSVTGLATDELGGAESAAPSGSAASGAGRRTDSGSPLPRSPRGREASRESLSW